MNAKGSRPAMGSMRHLVETPRAFARDLWLGRKSQKRAETGRKTSIAKYKLSESLRNSLAGYLMSFASLLVTVPARADGLWAVARSPVAFPGSCYVGIPPYPDPIGKQYSQILKTNIATRKAACQSAKDLGTDDPSDSGKCFAYSSASISDCKGEGVDLSRH
jgi:hypothetical protein